MSGFGTQTRRQPKKTNAPLGFPKPAELVESTQAVELAETPLFSLSSTSDDGDEMENETPEDDAIDEAYEMALREEIKAWLNEFGPKLFSLGLAQWMAKEKKTVLRDITEKIVGSLTQEEKEALEIGWEERVDFWLVFEETRRVNK